MKKGDYLTSILRCDKTVFTITDIAMLWQEEATKAARVRLSYFVKKGDLYRIRRGLYAKDEKYNREELAIKIFTPAYISFETVLSQEGIIFQYQDKITVSSYLTRDIEVGGQKYSYRKIKNIALVNTLGVKQMDNISKASGERAILDTLYNYVDYQFDNLRGIDWDVVFEMVPIYENKRLMNTINSLYKISK